MWTVKLFSLFLHALKYLVIFTKIFIEVIVGSCALVRNINNTEKSQVPFYPVLPSGNILRNYSTVSQPGCWHWYNPSILLRFPQFYLNSLLCVCILSFIQFYHVCMFIYPLPQSRYWTVLTSQRYLCGQFITTHTYTHTHTHTHTRTCARSLVPGDH